MQYHGIYCRRSSVNFGGKSTKDIFARKLCMKNKQNAQTLRDFFPDFFFWGGGEVPPAPVFYAMYHGAECMPWAYSMLGYISGNSIYRSCSSRYGWVPGYPITKQSMWAERSGSFCRSALNLIFLTSAHRSVPAPRPPAHASPNFSETRSPLRSAPPEFWPAPLTPVINSVANSGLLGLRVALFYSLLW